MIVNMCSIIMGMIVKTEFYPEGAKATENSA